MAEKKTKLVKGLIFFNGPLNLLPHYNKNQIITCVCENCKKQFNIKFCNLKKKTDLLCKSCGVKLHTPYKNNAKKISNTLKANNKFLTPEERYKKYVMPQLNRSEESKRKSIENFKNTFKNKSQSEIDLMKSKMKAAKAKMSAIQKKEREQKFLKSFYESQCDKIRKHAEKMLLLKDIKFNYEGNFNYRCFCEKCKNCYLWSPLKKSVNFMHTPHCPKCSSPIKSHYEIEICSMLEKMNIAYVHNDRDVIKPKEIDVYVPSFKLAIEFDGIHWHNNSTKNIEKKKLCDSKGIRLIDIFENEYDYQKIYSILQAIAKTSKIVYARKCDLRKLINDEYLEFCNENHIQNYENAEIKLGLFYNNSLIQIMSFSKLKLNEWEIVRECTKCGYGVVGGKERLFKNFVKLYDPKSIIAYCDKRYFTGESYLRLGMKRLKDVTPSFSYIKGCKMYDFGQYVFEWTNL